MNIEHTDGMRNYNTYLSGMEKANKEKLFFLDLLNINDFDTIIDFGCGKGDILKKCAGGNRKLIGIDKDDFMREIAKENVNIPSAIFETELKREMITHKTLIIFSSVLHEIENYWTTLRKIIANTGATIVVRDMRYSGDNELISQTELANVIRYSNPQLLAEFVEKYGLSRRKELYHWLLKYSYIDNWALELKENYFSFNYNSLLSLGTLIYENNYLLKYKKDKVNQDYHIKMVDGTHTQLIIKLNKSIDNNKSI